MKLTYVQTNKELFYNGICSEIVNADTKEEAIAIAKHRIQDRVVEVDEENTYQVEDEDLIKEIEENERKADEEARESAKPKK